MSVTQKRVEEALERLALPDGGTLISRDMIRALTLEGGAAADGQTKVSFVIEAPSPAIAQHMEPLRRAAQAAVSALDGVGSVSVALTAHGPAAAPVGAGAATAAAAPSLKIGGHPKPQAGPIKPKGVSRILAVASGKGGVGKSTCAVNLALGLQAQGLKVGILDADIYGPSLPRMLGLSGKPNSADGKRLEPMEKWGLKVMSMGFMVEEDTPMIWRGPMVMSALQQMIFDVNWGELDVLVVDMPPGTGDAQLTMAQRVPLTGAVIISTPQDIALLDARKGLNMFRKVEVPVLGIIENMSYFLCPSCGDRSDIFGHGGAHQTADELGVDFLGEVPLHMTIREASDAGTPVTATAPEGEHAKIYIDLAAKVQDRIEAQLAIKGPSIVVE